MENVRRALNVRSVLALTRSRGFVGDSDAGHRHLLRDANYAIRYHVAHDHRLGRDSGELRHVLRVALGPFHVVSVHRVRALDNDAALLAGDFVNRSQREVNGPKTL